MKQWNTRPWSTPATIGAGIFVATTGLTMFFVTEEPFKFAHELGGLTFSAAIVLHVLSHRRSFTELLSAAARRRHRRDRLGAGRRPGHGVLHP